MSALYLSRVELHDFRTFGRFALDIPAGPGLTLLVGTNGLGKSNFFDGIEWCLTNEVRRFSKHIGRLKEGDYLTRRDAPKKNSHKVSLQFTAGDPIVRTATIKPSETSLVDLLKISEWGDIKDLGAYLSLTHFLGQTAQQRFTSRQHAEQWEALKGPSGIDRLEEIRTTLRGRSTGNAFRRRIEEQQLRVTQAETALVAWQEASARLTRLQRIASASGAMPRAAFEASLAKLAADFTALTGVGIDQPPANLGERLVVLRQSIERESAGTVATLALLEPLRVVADRYSALVSQCASADEAIAATQARVADATRALSIESLASRTAERAVSAQAAIVARETEEIERLSSVRQSIEEKARLHDERQGLAKERVALLSSIATQESALAAARAILAQAIEDQSERLALEARQTALREIAARAGEIAVLENAARTRQEAFSATDAAAAVARDTIPELLTEITRLDGRIGEGDQLLSQLRRRASDMADALARIAGHLSEHDDACPVCASSFPPGVLKALAEAAAAAEDPGLTEQTRANQALVGERDQKRRALAEAEGIISAATTASREAAAARAELAAVRSAVALSLEVPEQANLVQIVSERLAAVAAALAPLLGSEATGAPSIAAAQASIATIEVELRALRDRLSTVEKRHAGLDAAILGIDEGLATFPSPVPTAAELTQRIGAQQRKASTARDEQAALERQRAAAVAAEEAARQRLESIQAQIDRLGATIAEARRDMEATGTQWTSGGLPGMPSQETLAAHSDALGRRLASLTLLLETQSTLARAHNAIVAQSELQILISDMEQQGGPGSASDPTAQERQFQQILSEAREALQLTQSTQAAVNAYAEHLKAEADDFATKFLKPLNDLVNGFNRALLITPGETVQFSADPAIDRTQFEMQLRYADDIDNALYNTELPPQLVLSEGQMAANGFSILCAASTAYPWSNWRALLLDDPLQHNDIIHAAAFVDMMRNLVELKDYQLIMSSHDRAESEFLARKFDAAGLPCTVLGLTALSKDGVRFDPPYYNAAARELMRASLAQTG